MRKIGITTTVPSEVLMAAGYQPVDLNNIFISDTDLERLVKLAERDGFPLNCCTWIKGIYSVCRDSGIESVLCATSGDCSNSIILMEVLKHKGFNAIPFAFPTQPSIPRMQSALEALADNFGTDLAAAEKVRKELQPCRDLAHKLDEMTWREGTVSGGENHFWLVSSSDFNRDPRAYHSQLEELVGECGCRQPYPDDYLRLAYIGVPPVFARSLYPFLESHGARVVFNEVQRQFAMPAPGESLAEQYTNYTYPYSIHDRIQDITTENLRRRVDGIIHYVQAFCHRGIANIIFKDALGLPLLTLEGNDDFFLSQHVKTRLEAFLDMLQRQKRHLKLSALNKY